MKRQQVKRLNGGTTYYCKCGEPVSREDTHCSACGEELMNPIEAAMQPIFDDIAVKHHGLFALDELDEGDGDF